MLTADINASVTPLDRLPVMEVTIFEVLVNASVIPLDNELVVVMAITAVEIN